MLTSILDNDFYKFTMQQCVYKLFPRAKARYEFINRGKHSFPSAFATELKRGIEKMHNLRCGPQERKWLANACPYLDPVYLDFLQGYVYEPSEVRVMQQAEELTIHVEGYWYRTILWEVPLLALVSELFYIQHGIKRIEDAAVTERTKAKIELYNQLGETIAEFGTRRRHSYHVQHLVVKALKEFGKTFVGTSNVHLAHLNAVKPIGTHAHEWFMFHAALYGFKMANAISLEHWVDIYRGELGIALTDTYTSAEFFKHFDKKFAKLFDGVRHDSGDPIAFADQTMRHYRRLGINPATKTIIFSDGLNYEKVKSIVEHCKGKIGLSFGIGTSLSNDVGPKPMNIVMKMVEAAPEGGAWIPVVKLSDEHEKHSGDPKMIDLAMRILSV
jgi:nicotinate phosphoribosyltransferase